MNIKISLYLILALIIFIIIAIIPFIYINIYFFNKIINIIGIFSSLCGLLLTCIYIIIFNIK